MAVPSIAPRDAPRFPPPPSELPSPQSPTNLRRESALIASGVAAGWFLMLAAWLPVPDGTFLLLFAVPIPIVGLLGWALAPMALDDGRRTGALILMGFGALYGTLAVWSLIPAYLSGEPAFAIVIVTFGLFLWLPFLLVVFPSSYLWRELLRGQLTTAAQRHKRRVSLGRVCRAVLVAAVVFGGFRLATAVWLIYPSDEIRSPTTFQILGLEPFELDVDATSESGNNSGN